MSDYRCVSADVRLGKDVKLSQFVNLYGCEVGDDTKIEQYQRSVSSEKQVAGMEITMQKAMHEGHRIYRVYAPDRGDVPLLVTPSRGLGCARHYERQKNEDAREYALHLTPQCWNASSGSSAPCFS